MGLLEILAVIDRPKRIVYGYGKAIGGEGVGIWAADNSQMFYPDSIGAETIVSALLTIQDVISRSCRIEIGIGAHHGNFYSLCGGLYGTEAEAIEEIVENHAGGGEVLISHAIYDRLPGHHTFTVERVGGLDSRIGPVYRVLDGRRLSGIDPVDQRYPIPYSEDFYADLEEYQVRLAEGEMDHHAENHLIAKYIQNKVVVLIESRGEVEERYEISMFNQLSSSALVKDVGLGLLGAPSAAEIKVVSSLAIYVFEDGPMALDFARTFRRELAGQGIDCRIGIDHGEVLIFDLPSGGKDIAGMPVNVASKMAQDKGEFGKIYLSESLGALVDLSGFTQVRHRVSSVEIVSYEG